MIALHQLTTPPATCEYLPDQVWSLHYIFVRRASAAEYQARLETGWRRFGRAFFHPVCSDCTACQSLRVVVGAFEPDRSQRRARQANADVTVVIGEPEVTAEKLRLYDRFHAFQSGDKGWPAQDPKEPMEYVTSFVDNPFDTEEWCYYRDGRLVGVGYVDVLPDALSAIYFYYDPEERTRSLGTYNVLRIIDSAAARGIPYVYLGYYVKGCRSLEYKARFRPNEVLIGEGWRPFRE
jgi:arginyl-tRNA--protein-N-Asp/Glu arginylyltransferase